MNIFKRVSGQWEITKEIDKALVGELKYAISEAVTTINEGLDYIKDKEKYIDELEGEKHELKALIETMKTDYKASMKALEDCYEDLKKSMIYHAHGLIIDAKLND